jgi:hypothetical protein
MTARLIATTCAVGIAGWAVWLYLVELRFERSFYRRYLLDTGRGDQL